MSTSETVTRPQAGGYRAAAGFRRLPTPATEPPFDDEESVELTSTAAGNAVQGTLALAFALPGGLPAVPDAPVLPVPDPNRRLRLVPPLDTPRGRAGEAHCDDDASPACRAPGRRRGAPDVQGDEFGPQPTPRALLPEPEPWAARLVQAIVEVTSGARPVGQLVRWTTTDVYEAVQRRISHAALTRDRRLRRVAPLVRSVHVDEPTDGVAEVCAVVQHGRRCRAIALRLEGVDGRWQCTALQVG